VRRQEAHTDAQHREVYLITRTATGVVDQIQAAGDDQCMQLRAAANACVDEGIPVHISPNATRELMAARGELRALYWVDSVAEEIGQPIAVDIPMGADDSATLCIVPVGYTKTQFNAWFALIKGSLTHVIGTQTIYDKNWPYTN
jgi:hypothetical protein